jgi:hypothetical protein
MTDKPLPPWEDVLSAACRLQTILPDAVLVGGISASLHVHHRLSRDADHILMSSTTTTTAASRPHGSSSVSQYK